MSARGLFGDSRLGCPRSGGLCGGSRPRLSTERWFMWGQPPSAVRGAKLPAPPLAIRKISNAANSAPWRRMRQILQGDFMSRQSWVVGFVLLMTVICVADDQNPLANDPK